MQHVILKAKVLEDNTGIYTEIPVIITDNGIFKVYVTYLLAHNTMSISWQYKAINALGLFINYTTANQNAFTELRDLFRGFAKRLYTGTLSNDGLDLSGLYWLPKNTIVVKNIIHHLSQFFDWLNQEEFLSKQIISVNKPTKYEEILSLAAYHYKRDNSFLGHTWAKSMPYSHKSKLFFECAPKVEVSDIKAFPEAHFHDLCFKGFINPGRSNSQNLLDSYNLRDILITWLSHYGGVRASEPFHLYVHDVINDPFDHDTVMVRIFHPRDGAAPMDWLDHEMKPMKCNRDSYLRGKYQLLPRHHIRGRLHAGWKSPLLDSNMNYFHIHWFPTWAGKMFKLLWDSYILKRAFMNCNHPFAFVNSKGEPYAIADYFEAHKRAVERIDLIPGKANGTTSHAHRHAYGQRLRKAGIEPLIIRKALHHKSIDSQNQYTTPSSAEILKIMDSLSKQDDNGITNILTKYEISRI
jgi:hypothetical protein